MNLMNKEVISRFVQGIPSPYKGWTEIIKDVPF